MFKATDVLQSDFILQPLDHHWHRISPLYVADESAWLQELIALTSPDHALHQRISAHATQLIEKVRADKEAIHHIDALLLEYSLDSKEGIILMCLAEALMRIPDAETANALIRDKLSIADWQSHLKNSDSLFVNASTWGLMLTGKVITLDQNDQKYPSSVVNRLVNKMSEPVIRQAIQQAMKIMGHQFVLGRTMSEALKRGASYRAQGYTYSFDMLGEAALTDLDAEKYFTAYQKAIEAVGRESPHQHQTPRPTISIKLSALHPRYEANQTEIVLDELFIRVQALISLAREHDVGITIDAEEADRLELSLQLFQKLYQDPCAQSWGKFGLVVQAYSKRALPVLVWLTALAKQQGDIIPLRLVKGAYWDSEIKLAQQRGLAGYPVYTRKESTDTAYLACARFLLSDNVRGHIYPQFATHNAHTVAAIQQMSEHDDFEFQRLHGMGDALYNTIIHDRHVNVRIYAPVGSHKDLLPYLVRRLLENGANSSFVHRLVDARCPIHTLVQHPTEMLCSRASLANPNIPLPADIYGHERKNSRGLNLSIVSEWRPLVDKMLPFMEKHWQAGPIINGQHLSPENAVRTIQAPYDHANFVGKVFDADTALCAQALQIAADFYPQWRDTPVDDKAAAIERFAQLLEDNQAEIMALCHREAGKTPQDSLDEVREAVDFCRYYSRQARLLMNTSSAPLPLWDSRSAYAQRQGLGVFVCISPWNFPLAIFVGQISAALLTGNTVVAKPAEQTSLLASRAIEWLLEAGIPASAIQFVPGSGPQVGAALTSDVRTAGVVFTGSTATAKAINRSLSNRNLATVPLIAETGGLNAMIVDSTALPEQVVRDVMRSAFASAGQRCSALRVLYVQTDIADHLIDMIRGAMQCLRVGDPSRYDTDVGPVIDLSAQQKLQTHIQTLLQHDRLVAATPLSPCTEKGTFIAPTAFEIQQIDELEEEHFGPILHIIRYRADELHDIISHINATGYGLTLGIHSRNESTANDIAQRLRVGNIYINRDQIGAIVGVQPFGGQGLSGTGPKAGGPHYLKRFTREVLSFTDAQKEFV